MSEMEYKKSITSKTSTNLGSISFNTGNIVGYNKTVSSSSSSRGNGSSASTATTMDLTYLLTDNIDETVTSERIADSRKYNTEKGWLGKIGDAIASTGATIGVGVTSILSGVADIGEAILDGGAWVSAKVIGIFNEDVANDIEGFIARDLVSEANEAFYENTEIGRAINDASALKYDSELAQGIRSVSEDIGVFVAATALTVCTGGAAAPALTLALGAAYGLGSASEDTYATHGTDTSTMQELMILANGGLSALSWYTSGKLGKGFIELGKSMAEAGVKEILAEMCRGIFSKETLKELFKPGNIVGNAIGTLMQTGGDIGIIANKLYNGIEVTPEEWALLVGELIVYFGLNTAEDVLSDSIMSYGSPKIDVDTTKAPDTDSAKPTEVLDEPSLGTTPAKAPDKLPDQFKLEDGSVRRRIMELENQAKHVTDPEQLELIEDELAYLNRGLVNEIHGLNNPSYEKYIQDVINDKVGYAKQCAQKNGKPLDADEIALLTSQAEEIAANTIANIDRLRSDGIFKEGISTEDIVKLIQSDVDPKTYLSTKAIEAWETDFGINGKGPDEYTTVYVFQDTSNPYCVANESGLNYNGPLGRSGDNGGAYVLSEQKIMELVDSGIINPDGTVTNMDALNKELGANYTGPMTLIGIDTQVSNLQLPRGNNAGAYLGEWCPGGMTSGGTYEAVIPATQDYVIISDSRTITGG